MLSSGNQERICWAGWESCLLLFHLQVRAKGTQGRRSEPASEAQVRDFSHSPRVAETLGQFPTSAASSGLAVFGFWVCFYGTKTSLHFLL